MELESIKKIYAGYSHIYDVLFKRFFYPRIKRAITGMDIQPGEKVLDVGMGTGLSLEIYPPHCEITGVDISSHMLAKAQKKAEIRGMTNVEFEVMDAMNLEFEDNTFDHVFTSHVVSVVPDPGRVMSEIKRVCKPGGQIVIVNHFKSRNKVLAKGAELFNPISRRIGWNADICLDEFLEVANLKVVKQFKLKKLDLWYLVFAINDK